MSTLRLTLKEQPPQAVDMSPLTADHLGGKSPDQVEAIVLSMGNRRVKASDLFSITGSFASEIEILNPSSRLIRIGQGMSHGRITVRGDAGAFLGAGMRGGHIDVQGNVGDFAGSGMRGGRIEVVGSAGDFIGAALPGDHHGMVDGLIVVDGSAGDRAGDRMRRGNILIGGDAGSYTGSRMVAGTLAVWGRVGLHPGFGMRRGTLLLLQAPETVPATFNDCGAYPLNFLPVLFRSWQSLPGRPSTLPWRGLTVRRLVGDRANDGRGEILVAV